MDSQGYHLVLVLVILTHQVRVFPVVLATQATRKQVSGSGREFNC